MRRGWWEFILQDTTAHSLRRARKKARAGLVFQQRGPFRENGACRLIVRAGVLPRVLRGLTTDAIAVADPRAALAGAAALTAARLTLPALRAGHRIVLL